MRAEELPDDDRLVPRSLPDAAWIGPVHQAAPGTLLLSWPSVGRALVLASGDISLELAAEADATDARWFTERPVREARDLLLGRFALRASAVVIDRRAVAFIGHGASGKSLIAATLAQRGHRVLADHLLPVSVAGHPLAKPTGAALDLWPAAAERLGLFPDAGAVVRPGLHKRAFRFRAAAAAPLKTVVVLDREVDVDSLSPKLLRGGDAVGRLTEASVGRVLLDALRLQAAHFFWITQLAGAVDVLHLRIDRHRAGPEAVADAIERSL